MTAKIWRYLLPILIACAATIPGIYLRLSGAGVALLTVQHGHYAYTVAIAAGLAVLGASFLLLWACDAAQEDISQTLALAIVALIAVLPEYAVDMYITWQAGTHPEYAHYAIANMTGANRLLIGVAWLVVVGIYWLKTRRHVRLEPERRTELLFLGMATVYALIIPLKGCLAWYDGLVFAAIYLCYIRVAGRRPSAESEAEGPAELLLSLPSTQRRLATLLMLLIAAGAIALNAAPFSEGLITTGAMLHINKATLIQWLAPIASEAPEFTVAIMFALRRRAGLSLGSLLSSNLNQWTLLVGMIPWVYALAHGSLQHPMPMDHSQLQEILLTAAQSLLAVAMLSTLRISIRQVLLIFTLFAGQLFVPPLLAAHPGWGPFGLQASQAHPLFAIIYFLFAAVVLLRNRAHLKDLWQGTKPDIYCTIPYTDETAEEKVVPVAEKV